MKENKNYKENKRKSISTFIKVYGVRNTFNYVKYDVGLTRIRIKHNKIQVKNKSGVWRYV